MSHSSKLEIVLKRRSDRDCDRQTIRLRSDNGDWEFYESLDAVPEELRKTVEGLLSASKNVPPLESFQTPFPLAKRTKREKRYREGKDSLKLENDWFDGFQIFLLPIVIAYTMYLSLTNLDSQWGILVFFSWCGFLFSAILTYYLACLLINRTVIEIKHGLLKVRYKPLPWFHELAVETDDLVHLYCGTIRNRHAVSYSLYALTKHGRRLFLIEGMNNKEECLSLERAIERHLGIQDWPGYGDI